MNFYDVDVLVQSPVTVRVEAASARDAETRALAGEGYDVSGVSYTYGEVVGVHESREQE